MGYLNLDDNFFPILMTILTILEFYLLFAIIPLVMLVDAAKEKGHCTNRDIGGMCALGIVFSPVMLGLYVWALPDRLAHPAAAGNALHPGSEEFPKI